MDSNQGKTTFSFRIMPDEKLKIVAVAQQLGMTASQYLESLILDKNNKIVKAIKKSRKPKKVIETIVEIEKSYFSKKDVQEILIYLEPLKELYPNRSDIELITVCLHAAKVNHKSFYIKKINELFDEID